MQCRCVFRQKFDTLFYILSTLDNNDSMFDNNEIMTVNPNLPTVLCLTTDRVIFYVLFGGSSFTTVTACGS